MGDFNANESNSAMETFLNPDNNIIKSKTYFKSYEGSFIDSVITSRPSTSFAPVFSSFWNRNKWSSANGLRSLHA